MTALSKLRLKIKREGLKNIKPPYLVISMHQGFSDYYIAPLALFPRRAFYVSDMEGFAGFGKALYRALGCIGKRRFVSDYSVIKKRIICFLAKEVRRYISGVKAFKYRNYLKNTFQHGKACKILC